MPTLLPTRAGQRALVATSTAHVQCLSSPAEQAVLLILTQWPKQSVITVIAFVCIYQPFMYIHVS